MELWQLLIIFFVSFLSSLFVTNLTIKKYKGKAYKGEDFGHVVPDLHKKGKPLVPRHGGIGTIIGISAGIFLAIIFLIYNNQNLDPLLLIGALITVILLGSMAFLDDLFKLREITRVIFPLFAALPIIVVLGNNTSIVLPFVGIVNFGIIYYVLVAVGITGASNATNMLAGFNGLGPGLGLISCSALFIIALHANTFVAALLLIATIGALLGLLIYNFQGKIFPGMANYLTGGVIASAVIIGKIEVIGLIIIAPYFLELILKARGGFRVKWWGILQNDGTLKPASKKVVSLPQILMKLNKVTERKLVLELYIMQICVGIVAIWVSLYI
jgi:UDP-N-acetylglucosamine--dolichyl-phosphate N-acetylglucosaminephosphotransferase